MSVEGWNESGLDWARPGFRFNRGVLSLRTTSLRVSQCRLSAGAQVKAALWIPLGGWGGPLESAGLDPSFEWLPEDLVSD